MATLDQDDIELREYTEEPSSHPPSRTPVLNPEISLHEAAKDGRVDVVRAWMDVDNLEIDARDYTTREKYTAFHYAAKYNHLEIMRILVKNEADPKLCTWDGKTALHLAAQFRHKPGEPENQANKETLKFLMDELHLDVNAKGGEVYGYTYPLHLACSSGNKAAVEVLLRQENIKTGLRTGFGENSILHEACITNNVELLELLLEKLKERGQLSDMLTSKNRQAHTPLDVAFFHGHLVMASKLLEYAGNGKYARSDPLLVLDCSHGKESDAFIEFLKLTDLKFLSCRNDGATILHLVSERGWTRAAREIVGKEPSLMKEKDKRGRTPLHYAAAKNGVEVISLLMDQETTEVDALDEDGCTPLLVAARQGCTDAFTKLLEKADLTKKGRNVVFLAAEGNHNAILEAAKEKDPGIFRQVDSDENTPLHVAAAHGSENTLKTLLDQLVDINARNRRQQTPLHLAARNGHNGFVEMLLAYGPCSDENSCTVNISAKDGYSNTALHLAAKGGHYKVAVTLLNEGAYVRARNNDSQTPLHCSAGEGHQQVVELLISEHHAEVDARDEDVDQWTPLHYAARWGHLDVVETLLRHKADLTAVTSWSKLNALEIAIENSHADVAMAIVKQAKWRDAMSHTSHNRGGETTPMRRLIRKMPEVALEVLNRCTDTTDHGQSQDPSSKEYEVTFDYEFLEDLREPDNTHHTAGSEEADSNSGNSSHRHWRLYLRPSYYFNLRFSKSKNEGHYTTWGPAGFDKANHPLNIMVECKRTELLDHPLVSTLIAYKWRKAWPLYISNLLFYVVFLSFLTSFALVVPNPQSELCRTFGNASDAIECINSSNATSYQCGKCSSSQAFLYAAGAIVLFCVVLRVIMEIFQFLKHRGHYFRNHENWLELFLYSFTLIFMSSLGRTCVCPEPWQWQIGALAVFLAWIHLSIFVRKLPQLGLYIIMFEDIVITFVKIAIPALLLVLAFSMAFYMMFFVPSPLFAASPFATPGLSIIKAMTMAVGEMDFETIFRLTSGGVSNIDDVPTPIPYSGVSILLWIFFLILIPILLMNLLTGLAVGDVEKIQSNAEYRKLELQIDLVLNVEEAFQVFHTWFVPKGKNQFGNKIERQICIRPNDHSLRKRVLSLLAGVDVNLTGENISKSLSDPIKHIKIEHVHKQTTTVLTEIATLRTEQKADMATLRTELRTELEMVHEKNRRMEKGLKAVLELLAKKEGVQVDTTYLDGGEDDGVTF